MNVNTRSKHIPMAGLQWGQPLPCPAKINRFLHIIGRRADGYHLLQSIFQLITLGDVLTLTPRMDNNIRLRCNNPELLGPNNLVHRAAALLQTTASKNPTTLHRSVHCGVDIDLQKRIPLGAGLGGGSSDAATTLLALNHYWDLNLERTQLAELGLELGADVPFFVHGRSAFVEGIGEQLRPCELDTPWLLIAVPQVQIKTATIFNQPDLPRKTTRINFEALTPATLGSFGQNDCEALVCEQYPAVRAARDWLENFQPARMTGTGACLFAMFDNETEPGKIAAGCPEPLQVLVSQGINQSPLIELLDR